MRCASSQVALMRSLRSLRARLQAMRRLRLPMQPAAPRMAFTKALADGVAEVEGILEGSVKSGLKEWYAIKMLEGEGRTEDELRLPKAKMDQIAVVRERLEDECDDDIDSIITS